MALQKKRVRENDDCSHDSARSKVIAETQIAGTVIKETQIGSHAVCGTAIEETHWKVTRCAAWSEQHRQQKEKALGKDWTLGKGISVTPPGKPEVGLLHVKTGGVWSEHCGGLWRHSKLEKDANHFRECPLKCPRMRRCCDSRCGPGESGFRGSASGEKGFSKGSNDRAVSLSTVDAYEQLRCLLPGAHVCDGDLGENIILDGPQFKAGADLDVGTVLRIGSTLEIQLMEANTPCYRLKFVPWAAAASLQWPNGSGSAPNWRKDPECPLSRLGGRGWLAKVLVEGQVKPGDPCAVVSSRC